MYWNVKEELCIEELCITIISSNAYSFIEFWCRMIANHDNGKYIFKQTNNKLTVLLMGFYFCSIDFHVLSIFYQQPLEMKIIHSIIICHIQTSKNKTKLGSYITWKYRNEFVTRIRWSASYVSITLKDDLSWIV